MERPRIIPTLAKCLFLSAFVIVFVLAVDLIRDYAGRALTTPAQAAPQPGQAGYDALFQDAPPAKSDRVQ